MNLSLPLFEERLGAYRPAAATTPGDLARAAVAIVLRFERTAPDILLMKRTERPGDQWSGQVSLPGGRESSHDRDLRATAVRETREEVGLDLDAIARPLGRLDTLQAQSRRGLLPLTITPYVFVQQRAAPLALNHEAEAAFWLPFDHAAAGTLSSEFAYPISPPTTMLPCWRHHGYVVWGLTYRILNQLLNVVQAGQIG